MRTQEDIQKEYSLACAELGETEFRINILLKNKGALLDVILKLNMENADIEAAKAKEEKPE